MASPFVADGFEIGDRHHERNRKRHRDEEDAKLLHDGVPDWAAGYGRGGATMLYSANEAYACKYWVISLARRKVPRTLPLGTINKTHQRRFVGFDFKSSCAQLHGTITFSAHAAVSIDVPCWR